jgi:hypothetical protein
MQVPKRLCRARTNINESFSTLSK